MKRSASPSGEGSSVKRRATEAADKGGKRRAAEDAVEYDEELTTLDAAWMRKRLDDMTDEQLERYEHFRRSHFKSEPVKQVMLNYLTRLDSSVKFAVTKEMTIVVAGLSKLFVGNIVETARAVMEERSETGPIMPRHIREAHRRTRVRISSQTSAPGAAQSGNLVGMTPPVSAGRLLHGSLACSGPQADSIV